MTATATATVTGRDPEAEILSWMLRSRSARECAAAELVPADFMSALHAAVFGSILDLHDRGAVIEPAAVAKGAKCAGRTVVELHELHAVASDLQAITELKDISGRRHLRAQLVGALAAVDGDQPTEQVNAACALLTGGLPSGTQRWEAETFEEMAARIGDTSYRWLIPWVLERGERLMLVGQEGRGKSTLLRQWAYMLAAGCHWITGTFVDPAKVLVIDAENPDLKVVRTSRWLHHQSQRWTQQRTDGQAGWVKTKTMSSLDLVSHRAHRDAVEDLIERYRPDLLIIGPLYKVGRNTKASYEESALAMTDVLDDWRGRYDIAVLMEHHAPKTTDAAGERALDPKGSSVWLSWPDVGIKLFHIEQRDEVDAKHANCDELRTHFHVGHIRGSRGQHHFPNMFRYGERIRDEWPWMAAGFDHRKYDQDGNDLAVF